MDLHFTGAQPSEEERSAVDGVLGEPEERGGPHWSTGGAHDAERRRHLLLPTLHAIADRVGWIGEGALNYACRRLSIPPAEAYGVASFYGLFSMRPRPPRVVHVCDDIACMAAGAADLCKRVEGEAGKPGTPSTDGSSTWLLSPCLGLCDRAPAALVISAGAQGRWTPLSAISASDVVAAINGRPDVGRPRSTSTTREGEARASSGLLRRIDRVDPESLDDYRASGGYAALRRAFELGPSGVVREVVDAKLVGRGGAAFPTGRKWEAVASEPARPHYLVCNADESEPGTFKDRVLMEGDPFAIVEAMTIAAFAGGCERGFIYVRGEYPLATDRLRSALDSARLHGLLGDDIMGRGFRFDIEIRRGAGAYVCGEETALFNSIEGYRGEPRNKPPFPVQRGLFGKPTIVNNVETLVNVPDIVFGGGRAFAAVGTADSTGTKLFCVTGRVARPGLYEIPFGVTLRELIAQAGGVRDGKRVKAVLLGGAAGTFVTPSELDTPLSFEGARAIGASLGSGVVFVLDDASPLWPILSRIAAFFRDESCGQCVPCRVGTVRQEELLKRVASGTPLESAQNERALLADIGRVMRDASICGLGQTASSAVESAFAKFDLSRRGPA